MDDVLKIAHVTWEDSESMEGWHTRVEIEDYIRQPLTIFKTLGWLLHDGDDYVILAMSAGDKNAGELMKIPKPMVKDIHILSDDGLSKNGSDGT